MGDGMDLGFGHSQKPKRQLPNADDTGHAEKKQKMSAPGKQTAARLSSVVTPESSSAAGPASGTDDNHQRSPQGQAAMASVQAAISQTTPVSSNGRESVAVADQDTEMATEATDLPSRANSVSTEASGVGMKGTSFGHSQNPK